MWSRLIEIKYTTNLFTFNMELLIVSDRNAKRKHEISSKILAK